MPERRMKIGATGFLLDVDNTLLDNDRIEQDLRDHLRSGNSASTRANDTGAFWKSCAAELGYSDFLGALQRYRLERLHDPRLLLMSSFLVDYPFADRLYPRALDVIARLDTIGAVILSDGDAVFQPRKVERWASGRL